MAVLSELRAPLECLMWEADMSYSREKVTILSGSGKLLPGTVLAKVTASGKYKPSTHAGSDGGQTAIAVLLYPVDATSADADGVVSARVSRLNAKALIYDASVDDDSKKATKIAQLAAATLIAR